MLTRMRTSIQKHSQNSGAFKAYILTTAAIQKTKGKGKRLVWCEQQGRE